MVRLLPECHAVSLQIKIDPTAEQWLGIATRTRAWLRAIAGRLRHRRALTPDHAKGAAWSLRVLAKRIEDGERLTAEERGAVDILLRQHADRIEDTRRAAAVRRRSSTMRWLPRTSRCYSKPARA